MNDKWWFRDGFLGLTTAAVARLGVVWNFIPRKTDNLSIGVPFLNIESSRSLGPLVSPIDGKVVAWNDNLLDNPDQLTNETWIVKVEQP